MATGGGSSVDPVQMVDIMRAINASQSAVEGQIKTLQDELRKSKEEVAENVAKKVKRSRPPEFKRKGNEKQYKFNEEVAEKLETAEAELVSLGAEDGEEISSSHILSTVEKVKTTVKEGIALLEERQKLIRLADRSEYGWDFVQEYQSDELAANSDDEKKISKAEKAAEQKILKKKKAGRGRAVNTKYSFSPGTKQSALGAPMGASSSYFPPAGHPNAIPSFGWGNRYQLTGGPSPSLSKGPRLPGPCFSCGEFGHLRSQCSKTHSSNPKYPPHDYEYYDDSLRRDEVCIESYELTGEFSSEVEWEMMEGSQEAVEHDWELGESGRYWEFEPDGGPVGVKGRLKANFNYWVEVLEAPGPILDIVSKGYVLPFVKLPDSKWFPNQKSARTDKQFVSETLHELLINGCVMEVSARPEVCSPLLVVTNRTGKKRLVINLKYVNRYLWKQKFKYEDMRTAMEFFDKDALMGTFDLKSGYHHVDIHEGSQKYLGFQWEDRYYVFTVLPFGLSTACYVFTKLLRPLVRAWRSMGVKVVLYIDDGIFVASSIEQAFHDSCRIREDLRRAGFVVNDAKSHWEPSHVGQWLGFRINLQEGALSIPQEKVDQLKSMITEVKGLKLVKPKVIAGIVGRIISMGLGIGPIARLRTRSLYTLLNNRVTWFIDVELTEEALQELQFWDSSIQLYNGQNIWQQPSAVRVVYSDASSTGYGGYTVEHGCHMAHGQWNKCESKQSSTWRELAAVARVLSSVAHKLANCRVKWFTDNQNVVNIITNGSRVSALQALAVDIFRVALLYHIRMEPEWIPRECNEMADYISRIVDHDDWSVNPCVFGMLDSLWGPHTVDRFASQHNAQLVRFNSRFWCPGSEAIDMFTVNWAGENNWWCPPVSLVPRLLLHAEQCHCKGTLVVPLWRSAVYWPMLCPNGVTFASFVRDVVVIPPISNLIVPGLAGGVLFKGQVPNTELLALRLVFDSLG